LRAALQLVVLRLDALLERLDVLLVLFHRRRERHVDLAEGLFALRDLLERRDVRRRALAAQHVDAVMPRRAEDTLRTSSLFAFSARSAARRDGAGAP